MLKHVSTPAPTKVANSARAPFTAPVGVSESTRDPAARRPVSTPSPSARHPLPGHAEQPIGPEKAQGIEDALDGAHEVQAHGVLCLEEVLELGRPDAVLSGDGAPGGDGGLEDGMQQRMAAFLVGLEDRQMDVAVADVAAARDEGAVVRRPARPPGRDTRGSPPAG